MKEDRCDLDDALITAWKKLIDAACQGEECAISSEVIVDFESKFENVYDEFASKFGIMDFNLFAIYNRVLIRLYRERKLIDTEGEMSFRNKEKILEIQSQLQKYCTSKYWASVFKLSKIPKTLFEKRRDEEQSRMTMMKHHGFLMGNKFSLMGKYRYFRCSVMIEDDGLEFFLRMNREFFESMMNDMRKERCFKKSDGEKILKRIGWSLSIFNEMQKEDWSEKQFESTGTFHALFLNFCDVVRKLNLKHRDVFEISLKALNVKLDSYEKMERMEYTLFFGRLKFMFYWAEISRTVLFSKELVEDRVDTHSKVCICVDKYWQWFRREKKCTVTLAWIQETLRKTNSWNLSELQSQKNEKAVIGVFREMMMDLIVCEDSQLPLVELLQFDMCEIHYARALYRWIWILLSCLRINEMKRSEFLKDLKEKVQFPLYRGIYEKSASDELVQVFLNDLEGRNLKHGIKQFSMEKDILVGLDSEFIEKTLSLARSKYEGLQKFEDVVEANKKEAVMDLMDMWKSRILSESEEVSNALIDKIGPNTVRFLKSLTNVYVHLAKLQFDLHRAFYMQNIPLIAEEVYKEKKTKTA